MTHWVVQYILNDVLHNPGGVHKVVFHLCMLLMCMENDGISERYTGSAIENTIKNKH